jgi:integrase
MSERDSTPAPSSGKTGKRRRPDKAARPAKPRPDFPLFAHTRGYWAKKIRGKTYSFGPWADPDAALEDYLKRKDDLEAGRTPRPDSGAFTVKDAVNAYLNDRQDKMEAGELSPRTFTKYKEVTDLIVSEFGKRRLVSDLRPDDFAALKKTMTKRGWGPLRVGDFIQHVRSVFKHAADADLIDRPVRFGPGFDRPSAKTLRQHKAKQGAKLFTAEEIRRLLDAAAGQVRATILLGINCGFGNSDVADLPLAAVDLDAAVIDFPRPKTGIARRCPLWPETVAALREMLANRPAPKDEGHAALAFLSLRGTPLCSVREKDRTDAVAVQFGKLLRALGIAGRKGRGFYALRHSFRTVADEAKDQPAADYVMGHEVPHMSSHYRETISDERLRAVTDYVRHWLFGGGQ